MVGQKQMVFDKIEEIWGETHRRIDLDSELNGAEAKHIEEVVEAIK